MNNIQNEIKEIRSLLLAQNLQQKEIMTVEDATAYLQLSKSRIYKLTSNKEIPHYVPGGKKIYFRKSELDSWVFQNKVLLDCDLENETSLYLSRDKKI